MSKTINEKPGGYALKKVGVQRIKLEQIQPTLQYVVSCINDACYTKEFDVAYMHYLGSTGKKEESGDIDIAMDVFAFPPDYVSNCIIRAFQLTKDEYTFNKGLGVHSFAVPIVKPDGNLTGHRVQLDIMLTRSIGWADFAYRAPNPSESAYSGAIRTLLLRAVTTHIRQYGIDDYEYNSDAVLMSRAGRTFNRNNGIERIFQVREPRKDGKGYLSRMTTITQEEYHQMFPHRVVNANITTLDPKVACMFMFNSRFIEPQELDTAENVIDLIKAYHYRESESIFEHAAKACLPLQERMQIPVEISTYFDT